MLLSILNGQAGDSTEPHATCPAPHVTDRQTLIEEVAAVRRNIESAHGVRVRFVIWAGAGSPDALGALKGGPMSYVIDSADPEKLKAVVDDMQHRAHEPIAKLLPSTLVIGRSAAAERLAFVYEKFGIDRTANFIDVEPERILPFALVLANKDLKVWTEGSALSEADLADARKLASFLRAQTDEGRDKITFLMPESWSSVEMWTRRTFAGFSVVTGEKPTPRQFHKASEPVQDRVFVLVQRKGEPDAHAPAIKSLRAAGYPMAALTFSAGAPLSRYMRFLECAVFALRQQTGNRAPDEDIDALTTEILEEAKREGGIEKTAAWKALPRETPKTLAASLSSAVKARAFTRGEIGFFGDLRYSGNGGYIRKTLETAARLIFRTPFTMPAMVSEAPGEMLFGAEGCFTILVLSAAQSRFALAAFEPDRHIAQFLAAKLALERKRALVRAILVADLSVESIADLERFFSQTANNL